MPRRGPRRSRVPDSPPPASSSPLPSTKTAIAAQPSSSRPSVVLDHTAFPHILDAVIAYAPPASLIALRRASPSLRARVDPVLFGHIRVAERKITKDGDPIVVDVTTPDGLVLPAFGGGVRLPDSEERLRGPPKTDRRERGRRKQKPKGVQPSGWREEHETLLALVASVDFIPSGYGVGSRNPLTERKLKHLGRDLKNMKTLRMFLDDNKDKGLFDRIEIDCPIYSKQAQMVTMLSLSQSGQLYDSRQLQINAVAQPSLLNANPMTLAWGGVEELTINIRYGPRVWGPEGSFVLDEWLPPLRCVVYIFTYVEDDKADVAPEGSDIAAFFQDLLKPLIDTIDKVNHTIVHIENAIPARFRTRDDLFGNLAGTDDFGQRLIRQIVSDGSLVNNPNPTDEEKQAGADRITFLTRDEYRAEVGESRYALATELPSTQ